MKSLGQVFPVLALISSVAFLCGARSGSDPQEVRHSDEEVLKAESSAVAVPAPAATAAPNTATGGTANTTANPGTGSAASVAASAASGATTVAALGPEQCVATLSKIRCKETGSILADADFKKVCSTAQQLKACSSSKGAPIIHFDHASGLKRRDSQKILVFALIHGDEPMAGRVAVEWVQRLQSIEPRNSWRIVPLLNPDGRDANTRMNDHGVDINRNFPTLDWAQEAQPFWEKQRKDPRRFPGSIAASEPETRCAIEQIKDFQPDMIVSIHTPYGVLDFDGPKVSFPKYQRLPWKSLGNYPGSLGRYMWKDHEVPVLTIELRGTQSLEADTIQDVIGQLAILSGRSLNKKKPEGYFRTL